MLSKTEEFKRGWTVVLAAAIGAGTGVSALTFYTLGAFMEPLSTDMGWTRAQISLAPLFMTASSLIMGPVAGGLADKYGARPVALVSQVLFVLAVAALSLTGPLWSFYAGFFLLAFVGCGTMPITWTRAITGWFFSARGLALGCALMGTGLMGMVAPSLATGLIGEFGWRNAYIGLACVPLIFGLPLALAFFRDPPAAAANPAGGAAGDEWGYTFAQAVRTRLFWQMAVGFFIAAAGVGAMLVHALPLLQEHGLDRASAAAFAGVFGISVVVGRLFTGFLLDRVFGPTVAAIMFAAPALASVLILVADTNITLCVIGIVVFGLAAGAEFDIAAYFVARYFGRKNYGAIYGLLYTIFVVGSAATPPLAGAVFDTYQTYDPALMGGIAIFIVAAILCGTLGAYPKETEKG
jgi:MFS family permease